MNGSIMRSIILFSLLFSYFSHAFTISSIKSRAFLAPPSPSNNNNSKKDVDKPKLILIGGCSGTGKSTFGMSVALDQGILKCISTDTLRSVMRSFIPQEISPALHRSSYEPATDDESDDPVKSWKQTCTVLHKSVEELIEEMINRGASIVIEGVHLIPSNEWIERWEASGGVATGIVLQVPDEEAHKSLLLRRGVTTGKGEEEKLAKFQRIRAIHDEMVKEARDVGWLVIEQNLQPDPLEMVATRLWHGQENPNTGGSSTTGTSRMDLRRSEEFLWHPEKEMGTGNSNSPSTSNASNAAQDNNHHDNSTIMEGKTKKVKSSVST